ncbi:MAG: YgiQ family radical SAM protein [Candidatus Marinimicrobia bacterium]|nr:YgiQ family radical SAM protein [Candidatus Neomarinimicrobiota bacterium]
MANVQKYNPALNWLPTTRKEVVERGWDQLDVILFSGDAYVDHPAFGHAVIGRIMESLGLRVAIIPQPNWQDDLRDFRKLGQPRLFFAVSGGAMDPMVNHYTAARRLRSNDAYTPGGVAGFRPDYATSVYSLILKQLFPSTPVLIGGIEASLRRVTHYDYWSDALKPSILIDSLADLLVYGMGEQPLRSIIKLLQRGVPFSALTTVPQTALLIPGFPDLPQNKNWDTQLLASHERCVADKMEFARNFKFIEQESNRRDAHRLIQETGGRLLVINPPYPTMTEPEIDASFNLPYTRQPHPKYKKRGPVPAYEMIRHSINLHRGCFGGCSFCTISAHQGKFIASRSKASIMQEVEQIAAMPDFKGYISDLGGPSANMYKMDGIDQSICDTCLRPSCIHPTICSNLDTNHGPLLDIYQSVAKHNKIKKAFVTSGVRHDLLIPANSQSDEANHYTEYAEQLVREHVSGRLKIAPEHTSDIVLKIMRKPSFKYFYQFKKLFDRINKKAGLKQQLIPYFISSHPGSKLEDMAELAAETMKLGFKLEQVQDFTPTPMTVATVIYYSGYHPTTLKKMYTARTPQEKQDQNRFFFWYKKENRKWILNSLAKMKNKGLIQQFRQPGQARNSV